MSTGLLVAIVGPSGAGKDTLIAQARGALAGDPAFLFVRRIVTRPADQFEDNDSLTEAEFERLVAAGQLPLWWRAHGLGYAVPAEVADRIDGGAIAVCNLSRAALPAAARRFQLRTVEVTAPPAVLAERLARRGREDRQAVDLRMRREASRFAPDATLDNSGPIEASARALIAILNAWRLQAPQSSLQAQ